MSKKISMLSSGNLVKLNENGVAKKYIFLQYNHYGRQEVTLLRKDAACVQAYLPGTIGYVEVNSYAGCGLDDFCNTTFINRLDPAIKACLINVPIPVMVGNVMEVSTFDTTIRTLERRCFILSLMELGQSHLGIDGKVFSYLTTAANRIAYYDETERPVFWWLRTPLQGDSSGYDRNVSGVEADGDLITNGGLYVVSPCYSVRPALTFSSEILVSDYTDSDGCYTVEDAVIAGEQYQKVNGVWRRMC